MVICLVSLGTLDVNVHGCSIRCASGGSPWAVSDEDDEKVQLRALIEGAEVAVIGRRASETPSETIERETK